MQELKKFWKDSFHESIRSIDKSLQETPDECHDTTVFRKLAQWMMTSKHDPYYYMPIGFQNFRENPFEADSVLSTLHHALCDDGDVSFVTMSLEGKILRIFMVFSCRHEDYFPTICQKENQSMIESYIHGRESSHRVFSSMKEKHPEKEFNIPALITMSDFSFEAHRDPIQFIQEFEQFREDEAKRTLEMDQKLKAFRSRNI